MARLGQAHPIDQSRPPRPDRQGVVEPPENSDPALARQRHYESAARTYPRRIPLNLVSGRGILVRDSRGDEYLDCLAGAGALPLGHSHPVVVAAIEQALRDELPLTTLDLTTPAKDAFIEQLFSVLPAHLAHHGRIQFCGPSGADAVEAALKLAKIATDRTSVVAFGGGYHGMTHGALALTGARGPKLAVGPLMPDVHHLPFPSAYRCPFGSDGDGDRVGDTSHDDDPGERSRTTTAADASAELCARALDWALHDDHSGLTPPAAVVIEPVQGEGGVHPAPESFARAVRASTRRAGTVLVADEVQTGLGRTGTLWASTPLGLEPDVMVLSKAIGGGLPLAAIVYRDELDVWSPGAHAGTFRGNQLAMATGAATIRHVVDEGLADHAGAMGVRLMAGLRSAGRADPRVGDVRGRGLMVGVEMVDPTRCGPTGVPEPDGGLAARVQRAMLDRRVIVEVGGRADAVVRFLPPLVIEPHQVDRVVEVFAAALAATSPGVPG
ncbi:MAG TPA: aminotransferase class III-fold pyridoxal phosphate-dependent enzyme [Acidimicrobiales bacterium]|nr:aminotransferase class III-fold pyridoxal phosphate-dependent enzyme [Acidimicrobiales bacterium]